MKKRLGAVALIGIAIAGWYLLKGQPAATPTQTATVQQKEVKLDPTKHDFFDVDFSQKMLVHHQQGIAITDAILMNSTNQSVRELASNLRDTQVEAEQQYRSWLDEWGEKYTNLSDFPQMDGHDMYPSYPGLVSAMDLSRLQTKRGAEADSMFISLIREHHEEALDLNDMSKKLQYGELIEFKSKVFAEYRIELQELEKV